MKRTIFLPAIVVLLMISLSGFANENNQFAPYKTKLPFLSKSVNSYIAVATCPSPGYPTLTIHVSAFNPGYYTYGVNGDTLNAFTESGYIYIGTDGVYFSGFSTYYIGNAGSGYIEVPDGFYPYD